MDYRVTAHFPTKPLHFNRIIPYIFAATFKHIMNRIFPAVFFFCLCCAELKAQKPLPDFSVVDLNKTKARISWINKYGDSLIQLNVQVSFDSLKFYKTIFSTESPELPQNGFVYTLPYPTNFTIASFMCCLATNFIFQQQGMLCPIRRRQRRLMVNCPTIIIPARNR